MSFAEALNEAGVRCGLEEGFFWLLDQDDDEPKEVGGYRIGQTNAGVRWELEADGFAIEGIKDDKVFWATFQNDAHQWVE